MTNNTECPDNCTETQWQVWTRGKSCPCECHSYNKENEVEHKCEEPKCRYLGVMNDKDTWMCSHSDNPKAPGIVRYAKKPSTSPATWDEWFEKWAVMLDGTALVEANKLYKGKK